MDEIYPGVYILEKDTEYQYGSDATEVDNILKKVDSLKGKALTEDTLFEFEFILQELLGYVTLIGFDMMENYYSLERHQMERVLLYFYDEDMIKILGLQLMADNSFGKGNNITKYLDELNDYKSNCLNNNRCLVYEMDETYGDVVFKLNPRISDLRRL